VESVGTTVAASSQDRLGNDEGPRQHEQTPQMERVTICSAQPDTDADGARMVTHDGLYAEFLPSVVSGG
jgi:hypothetical protein